MKYLVISLLFFSLITWQNSAVAKQRYGQTLCEQEAFKCIKIKRGQSWEALWPDPEQRDIVKRVNRMNIRLQPYMTIAVPKNLANITIFDVAPFPRYIENSEEKLLIVSQQKLAWGAYDETGELLWWGPIAPGRSYCSDVPGGDCSTPDGTFRILRKQGIECVSTAFPKRFNGVNGGAVMPYCMHFYRGYAMHGSYTVPGHRDSHGCIRMFIEDAKWINQEFINIYKGDIKGTKVIISPAEI